jgi:nicotinamide-nucleotide adenylyltransferase
VGRGLLIGRFQPFHAGHAQVVAALRAARPDEPLVLGIGSAQESYTWKNPFTAGERFEMIERAIAGAPAGRTLVVPIPDIQRHAQWVAYVESLLPPFERVYTNNPLTRLLFERGGYAVESPALVDRARFEGEHIRTCLAEDEGWKPLVPAPVASYLSEIRGPERLRTLRASDAAAVRGPEP